MDLRALLLGAGAWIGALVVLVLPGRIALATVGLVVVATGALVVRRRLAPAWLAPVAALAAVAGVAALQQTLVETSPVSDLAAQRAVVSLRLEVTSDAKVVTGQFGDMQVVDARATRVSGRGDAWRVSVPVVVMADADWPTPPLGATLDTTARLVADDDVAALVRPVGSPSVVEQPGVWWHAAAAVRRSVRAAVADRGVDARELVPALVDGDDGGLDPDVAYYFRTTGLTHLLAVSGTNLTLVVGFLIILGQWL